MKTLLREPLVQFIALGLAIFLLYATLDDSPRTVDPDRIEITTDDARMLAEQFGLTWRRPPTDDELARLVDQYIREEIYVREALALSLDRGDAVIRQRLRQKMEFLTETGAQSLTPDEATLQAYLEANADRFLRRPLVGFDQIALPPDMSAAEIEAVRAALNRGEAPPDTAVLALLPPSLPPSPPTVVDGTFGNGFFDAIVGQEPGHWFGPVPSGFGSHLVRVTEAQPAELPPLDQVRDQVERDWRAELAERLKEERFEALKARYRIVTPDVREVLGQ